MDSSNLSEAEVILEQLQRQLQQCSWGQASTTRADAEAGKDREVDRPCPPDVHGARTGGQSVTQAAKPQRVRGILAALQEVKEVATAAGVVTAEQGLQNSEGNAVGKRVHCTSAAAPCYAAEVPDCSTDARVAVIEAEIEESAGSSDDGLSPIQQGTEADGPQAPPPSSRRSRKKRPREQSLLRDSVPGSDQYSAPEDAWGCRQGLRSSQESRKDIGNTQDA